MYTSAHKTIAAAATFFLAVGATLLPSRSNALPLAGAAGDVRLTIDSLNLIEKAQWSIGAAATASI